MKHLFYIHSHTLYLTAIGVIESLELKPDDVVLVYSRGYKNAFKTYNFSGFDISEVNSKERKNSFDLQFLKTLIHEIDDKLADNVGGEFIAYLPHTGRFVMQVISSHFNCVKINFIEEGVVCYAENSQVRGFSLKELVRSILNLRITSRRFWYTEFIFFPKVKKKLDIETFGISNETFKHLTYKKNIVKWPEIECEYNLEIQYPIFVFEAAIEMGIVSKENYLKATEDLILNNASDKNYIKFHPNQNVENTKLICEYFKRLGKEIIELPNDIPFECFLLKYSGLTVVGFGSSLILYAKNNGHKVITYESKLLSDIKYQAYKKTCNFQI